MNKHHTLIGQPFNGHPGAAGHILGGPAIAGWPNGHFPHVQPNPVPDFFDRRINALGWQLPAHVRAILDKPVSYFQEMAGQKPAPGAQPLTNVAFILDKSTSMGDAPGKKESTIEGFNTQVQVVRKGAEAAGRTLFTEVQFGSNVEVRRVAAPLETLQLMTKDSYDTSGWTALYDALGDTVAALLATEGINNPSTATLVTLFTDGQENYSKRYDTNVLRQLVERLEATGRWTFALVGPRGSVNTLAALLAIKATNVAAYNPESVQSRTEVFGAVAGASASYMNLRSMGATQACNLYADTDVK